MIADKFIASLGVLEIDLEKNPELRSLIVEKVKSFYRMGGAISWADISEMDEATVSIFAQAHAEVRDEQSARTADLVVAKVIGVLNELMAEAKS